MKIWLDTEEVKKAGNVNAESLKNNVEQSLALLVFLSQGYLTAEFCQVELRTAHTKKVPIIIVCDDGVTKDTLEKEIKEFEDAKGQSMNEEDKTTLEAMNRLKGRVAAASPAAASPAAASSATASSAEQPADVDEDGNGHGNVGRGRKSSKRRRDSARDNEKPADAVEHTGDDEEVLWWSRAFFRMTLKGVVLQLLRHDHHRQSPPPSKLVHQLLFHDELRFSQQVPRPRGGADAIRAHECSRGSTEGAQRSLHEGGGKSRDQSENYRPRPRRRFRACSDPVDASSAGDPAVHRLLQDRRESKAGC